MNKSDENALIKYSSKTFGFDDEIVALSLQKIGRREKQNYFEVHILYFCFISLF